MRSELLRILLVDDNHHMRVLLTEILRAIGVKHVYEANDGAEALQVMRSNPIDIIMSDLAMQPLDGPNPMAPVIMITGHSTQKRVQEARDVGVNEFLSKPVTARGVLERIAQVVDNPRAFVRTGAYFGPDRRRRADPNYTGPRRRASDKA